MPNCSHSTASCLALRLLFHRSLESVIEGHLKHKVAFTKGRGALLAMLKPRLHAIAYPGRLSRLLNDQHEWGDMVIVSEVYTCRSYARLLTHHTAKEITVGLGATVPVAVAVGLPISVGGDVDVQWQTDATRGDWKAAHFERIKPRKSHRNGDDAKIGNEVNEDGPLCYPLFKLVALRRPHGAPISAVRGTFDYELPVAIPPWINDDNRSATAEEGTEEEDDGEEQGVGELSEEEMKQGEEDKREGNEQVRKPWWNATVGRSLSCVHWAVRVTHLAAWWSVTNPKQSQAINSVIESLSRHH